MYFSTHTRLAHAASFFNKSFQYRFEDDSMRFCAIFDWDGVIIDSSRQHRKSWEMLARERNLALPAGYFDKSFGMKNQLIIPNILHWTTDPEEIERLSRRKEELYREILSIDEMRPLPGVEQFCAMLHRMRIPCALASSTPRENIDLALRRFSFASVFDTIVAAEDAPASKPDPSSFLTAARRLEAHPAECVIFEDAPAGIIAAHEAGMKVVAVATTRPLRALGGADIVVQRLDELSAAKLEDLFVYGVRHRL